MYDIRRALLGENRQPTGAAYARAKEENARREKAAKQQRRVAEAMRREEDAELAAQMRIAARLNGEVS